MATIAKLRALLELDAGKFHSELERTTKSFDKMSKSLIRSGKEWSLYVTAPLVGIATAASKASMEFEASLSKIVGLVGVAESQVASWRKEILALAPAVGIGPQKLADALYFVTSAGLRGKAAMDVLTISAKATAAGLGETAMVADLLTSAINAYGSGNLSAVRAADVLTAAVREGKAEASELTSAMGMVLPVASEMGVAFDQVAGAIAAMTRTGTDAGTASIQLRQILASLLKPTSEAEKTLAAFGTSASDVRKMIREQGLLAVLTDLKQRFGDNEEAASKVFGNIRALSGVLDLVGANAESNAQTFQATAAAVGDLDKAYQAAGETVKQKWNTAVATAQTALIEIGDAVTATLLPALEDLTEALKKATAWFIGLDEGTKQAVVGVAAFVAAVGPALILTGLMAKGVSALSAAYLFLATKAIPAAISAIQTLHLAIGPIGWAILAITGLMIAWEKNWLNIQERSVIVFEYLRHAFVWLTTVVERALTKIHLKFIEVLQKILDLVRPIADKLPKHFRDAFEQMNSDLAWMRGQFEDNLDRLDERWDKSRYRLAHNVAQMKNQINGLTGSVLVAAGVVADLAGNIIPEWSERFAAIAKTLPGGGGDGGGGGGGGRSIRCTA